MQALIDSFYYLISLQLSADISYFISCFMIVYQGLTQVLFSFLSVSGQLMFNLLYTHSMEYYIPQCNTLTLYLSYWKRKVTVNNVNHYFTLLSFFLVAY